MVSADERHVPAFLKAHQAGSGVLCEARSMTTSLPEVCRSPAAFVSNVPMSVFVPLFELQANVRLIAPPSVKQLVQRSPTPAAAATVALTARRSAHSRVTFFIATASET